MEETAPEARQPPEFPILLPALGVSVCAVKDSPPESHLLPSLPQGSRSRPHSLLSPYVNYNAQLMFASSHYLVKYGKSIFLVSSFVSFDTDRFLIEDWVRGKDLEKKGEHR